MSITVFSKCAQTAAQFVLLLVLMVAPVASEVLHLECEVFALPGNLFRYQLRPKAGLDSLPLPEDCVQRGWQDIDKNVLTLDSDVDVKRVKNVTDWTMDLKECLDYAHFHTQCSTYMEVICKTNCSSVSQLFLTDPPNMDPSTKSCEPSCVDWNTVIAVSVVAVIVVLSAVGLLVWKLLIPRFRRKKYIQGQAEERNPEAPENPVGN